MEYLFQVSIGPVQTFIASARRSRDLWFGSNLLSELAKAATKKIAEKYELKSLIFPAPKDLEVLKQDNEFNVANKIVAVIQGSPEDLGREIRQAVFERLHDIRDNIYQKMTDFNRKVADKQVDDLVEYLWAALPYEINDYALTRQSLEALMAARKNTRNFHQVDWGGIHLKSSIDGQLESVISDKLYPQRRDSLETRRAKANFLYTIFGANPAEHLSGVDLLKRRGILGSTSSFPSTSHIATIPFLQRLADIPNKEQVKLSWDTYVAKLREIPARIEFVPNHYHIHPILGKCEGSLLFEERFVDLIDVVDDAAKFGPARDALQAFFKQVDASLPKDTKKARPIPYYALLLADGDSMGKVIDNQAQKGPEKHRQLSQALDIFARKVRSIVEEKQGSLIYAGGDDVLAFIPLHAVLQCAQLLAKEFYEALKEFTDHKGDSPTLSVGIAVIHHLHPLRDALDLARSTEKSAKKFPGKNALAITISKRSGSDYTIAGRWKIFDERLNQLINLFRAEEIPEGTAYELRDLTLRLASPANHPTSHILQKVIEADTDRILQRKLKLLSKDKSDTANEATAKHQQITTILEAAGNINQFADELIAAQFFADVMELAKPTKGIQL